MKIISKTDAAFIGFYALLIALVGVLVFVVSGQALALPMIPLLLTVYLLTVLRKPLRRRRALRVPLPSSWHDFMIDNSVYYRGLDEEGKKAFERDMVLFLSDNSIAGIGGVAVDWQTRLLIAAGVAAMLHGRPEWEPPLPDGVTVYPGLSFDRNYRTETGNIAGQAPERGPLLIAEASLKQGFAAADDGRNVLIHELAHFFDRELRKSGRGPLRLQKAYDVPWADFIAGEWEKHLRHGSILPSYAALNEAEFFAVACEMFFERPGPLQVAHPELFEALSDVFNQDPRRFLGYGREGTF